MFQNNKLKNLNFGRLSLILISISIAFLIILFSQHSALNRFLKMDIAWILSPISFYLGAISIVFGLISIFIEGKKDLGIWAVTLGIVTILFMILYALMLSG